MTITYKNLKTKKVKASMSSIDTYNPVDVGRKLSVHKMFRRRPGRLLNVLCTFDLHSVPIGKLG